MTDRRPDEWHWLDHDGDARTACGLLPHEYYRATSIFANVECPSCRIAGEDPSRHPAKAGAGEISLTEIGAP